jgi:two-component system chemotaxis response regulator CheB
MLRRKIRVLVVDDSIIFREVLSKGISSDPGIEVVAVACDPYDAVDKINRHKPDIMTCDVEMPKMNGIDFIRKLLPQYPLPVIVVSSVNKAVFDAMEAGAVDFVAKPDVQSVKSVEQFILEMIEKIKIASVAKVSPALTEKNHRTSADSIATNADKLIVIGASTGGTEAIYSILRQLPASMPGIVIVQHIPPIFSRMFANRLNESLDLDVKEAENGDYLEKGRVLVAPGDKHVKIVRIGDGYKVHCFAGEKVNGHCPSVDVLFESAAKECSEKAIGVILTGMGYDGAKGLLSMRRRGARTIGQDEESSIVYGMPKVAYNIGAVEIQAALDKIPQVICSILRNT